MLKQSKSYIVMNPDDNCATALEEIPRNSQVQIEDISIIICQKISLGHKFSLKKITRGDLVIKYGQSIGIATEDINIGDWIHTHNLTSQYLKEVMS